MKTKIIVEQEVEATTLQVKAPVRYWEDSTVNGISDTNGDLMPCRDGDDWCPEIDIDTGVIRNWKQGVTAEVHYKVCDEGSYYLIDNLGNTLGAILENYVPTVLCPDGDGYGDYIIMTIDENGHIKNWNPDVLDFNNEDSE